MTKETVMTRGQKKKSGAFPKGHQVDPRALARVSDLVGDRSLKRDELIEYLHVLQDAEGCLQGPHLVALAHLMRLSPVEVFEVASFYHHFDLVTGDDTPPAPLTVRVCDSLSCAMAGGEQLASALEAAMPTGAVRVQRVPCVGRCAEAPVAVVGQNAIGTATPDAVAQLVEKRSTQAPIPNAVDYRAYCASGGYQLLKRVMTDPALGDSIIDTLDEAGLRGLGGAGFPSARKWRILREQAAPRLMTINLDEGEPGTFKDRVVLEADPHRMFEGMLIAAQVVGCDAIYIYLRDEYAGIRALLERELAALKANPPAPLPEIHLRRGAGAYVCGEESALIESLEGKRGMPRLRPPYVAQLGLFGRPTLAHNGETLWWVRDLVEQGAASFAQHGENGRKGLRRFSVSGRVAKPGVVLAPAGITLRKLVDEYCGGMAPGHELYGYFPGGASGGILPERLADVPLDFDTLHEHGCFIGSAAVVVFSTQDRARDLALNAMRFFAHESCGKCTPCRVGTSKAAMLMAQPVWDQPLLKELSDAMKDASICGLGQAASNPMECAMRYFPEEFSDE